MEPAAAADIHADTRPGIDPVEARLGTAPDAEAGRPLLADRPGEGRAAVEKEVAALEADDAALRIEVEVGQAHDRRLVEPAFGEQGKGIAAAPIVERLPPLEREGNGNGLQGPIANA